MSDTTIETPYGMDLLWASHKDYACKILVFHKAKNRTSMYFHKNTDKTWFCNASNSSNFKGLLSIAAGKRKPYSTRFSFLLRSPPYIACTCEMVT